jgi:endonuclease/exonuclease/phosphatase family metal-dependent hydrolase
VHKLVFREKTVVNSFRIATFNVENLLHPGVRFAGRGTEQYSEQLYADKIGWIGRILDEGAPDIVGFQELFSRSSLEAALASSAYLRTANIYAPDLDDNIAEGRARGPFVGLATRFEILERERIERFPQSVIDGLVVQGETSPMTVSLPISKFQRPVLRVKLALRDDVTATVFVAHLKSKRGQFLPAETASDPLIKALGSARSLILRAAESVALRALVLDAARGNDQPVFVLGDLNDDLPAVTTQTIAGEAPFRLLRHAQKQQVWDRLLYSAHDLQEQLSYRDVSYSHIFDGRYELLDHIFVSQEFYRSNPDRLGEVRNTRIFNDHLYDSRLVTELDTAPLSARSDHGIPVTEIAWR